MIRNSLGAIWAIQYYPIYDSGRRILNDLLKSLLSISTKLKPLFGNNSVKSKIFLVTRDETKGEMFPRK